MAYRELRDAVEILRFLNYPRLVSIENFRLPNFPLMAEILEWTVRKFDQNYRVPKSIETEQDRVLFVKTCVLALVQKARVKLNPKNLYQSDGYAVREILPVLRMLYEGNRNPKLDENEQKAQLEVLRSQINFKRQEIRECINKVLELPQQSANLYDLLAKELMARESRTRALSQSLNIRDVEESLRNMINLAKAEFKEVEQKMENINNDERILDEKIERRERDLEQSHKRLAKTQTFRPAHMDEFERLEIRLQNLYNEYILHFRNLAYLNEKLAAVERHEQERSAEAEKLMRETVEKMKEESRKLPQLSGEEVGNIMNKVYGNMTGAGFSDEDDDDDEGVDYDEMNIDEVEDGQSLEDDGSVIVDERKSATLARRREQQRPNSLRNGENELIQGHDLDFEEGNGINHIGIEDRNNSDDDF